MKFWQIAAAILMFKAFDGCWTIGMMSAGNNGPLVVSIVAIFVWLIVSIFIWAALKEGASKLPGGTRND